MSLLRRSLSTYKTRLGRYLSKPRPRPKFQEIYDNEGEDAFVKAMWEDIIRQEDYEHLQNLDVNYDCLAFEGGGVKGTAYAGAVKVLEDLQILPRINRYAGTSAGAYMAMQLAIGMSIDAIFKSNGIPNLQTSFYDSKTWSMPVNIMKNFGWQSGQKMLTRIEDDLEKYLGNRNATFLDLYRKLGKELCVVVTDLNGRSVEYCHPKTMPGVKIAEAVKTSMSLPFLFAPSTMPGQDMIRYLVDGGLLENFPIRVYDGWYLSMAKEDDFFERMDENPNTKFQGFNDKMLGMVVFSHSESQSHSSVFIERYGDALLDGRPDSLLSRKRDYTRYNAFIGDDMEEQLEISAREIGRFIANNLRDKADEYGTFDYQSFQDIVLKLREHESMAKHLEAVVGPEGIRPLETAFEEIDADKNSRICMVEVLAYLQRKGLNLRYNLSARHPRKIDNMTSFIMSIIEVMQSYISEMQEKPDDQKRTIAIYTDYVTTTDFDMGLDDKAYMVRQGYKACINFLKDLKEQQSK